MKLCMYSKDILTVVLEKFHEIPFTNKKVACQAASKSTRSK